MSSSPESTEGSTKLISRAAGAATGRWAALIAVLLVLAGVANNLGSLGWGFVYDDYAHQLFLRHPDESGYARPWSLYDWGACPGPGDPFFQPRIPYQATPFDRPKSVGTLARISSGMQTPSITASAPKKTASP